MPFYRDLDAATPEGKRTLERLLALRASLQAEVPARTLRENLLLATWNIRDFDTAAYGDRLEEAIYYIAEIISHFDLIAIQEVNKDLRGLKRVMRVLGSHWGLLFTDETAGAQGNEERLAYLFDTRKVRHGGLASELVLPPIEVKDAADTPVAQVWRTPFIVGFKSGWSRFMLATVHITWGAAQAEAPLRVEEIRQVAQFLKKRTEDKDAWARNLILLGDFNIFGTDDETFRQFEEAGFTVPERLLEFRSNATKTRHYDQIAFRVQPGRLDSTDNAGVFDYYQTVFRNSAEDRDIYAEAMRQGIARSNANNPPSKQKKTWDQRGEAARTLYYKTYWRTHQMSDHLPMWVELRIDYSDEYLRRKLGGTA